jgi:hypothetical protein
VHGNGQDKFLFTLRDGDGDTADTALVIDVTDLQGGITPSPLMDKAPTAFAPSARFLASEQQDELIELPSSYPPADSAHAVESLTTTDLVIHDLLAHDDMDTLLTQVAPTTQDSGSAANPLSSVTTPANLGSDIADSNSHTMPNPILDELLSQQQFIQ